jgi:hypothetical protein
LAVLETEPRPLHICILLVSYIPSPKSETFWPFILKVTNYTNFKNLPWLVRQVNSKLTITQNPTITQIEVALYIGSTNFVLHAGFKLTLLLLHPHTCWDYRCEPPCQLKYFLILALINHSLGSELYIAYRNCTPWYILNALPIW